MKRNFTATCFFLSLIPVLSFAGSGRAYFAGSGFKVAKTVQMLGATATTENLEHEEQINSVVETNSRRFQYCYERALIGGPLPRVEFVIYFAVSHDGKFSNVTTDLLNFNTSTPSIVTLFSCIRQEMNTFRAGTWDSDKIFRFLVTFEGSN